MPVIKRLSGTFNSETRNIKRYLLGFKAIDSWNAIEKDPKLSKPMVSMIYGCVWLETHKQTWTRAMLQSICEKTGQHYHIDAINSFVKRGVEEGWFVSTGIKHPTTKSEFYNVTPAFRILARKIEHRFKATRIDMRGTRWWGEGKRPREETQEKVNSVQ